METELDITLTVADLGFEKGGFNLQMGVAQGDALEVVPRESGGMLPRKFLKMVL